MGFPTQKCLIFHASKPPRGVLSPCNFRQSSQRSHHKFVCIHIFSHGNLPRGFFSPHPSRYTDRIRKRRKSQKEEKQWHVSRYRPRLPIRRTQRRRCMRWQPQAWRWLFWSRSRVVHPLACDPAHQGPEGRDQGLAQQEKPRAAHLAIQRPSLNERALFLEFRHFYATFSGHSGRYFPFPSTNCVRFPERRRALLPLRGSISDFSPFAQKAALIFI